MWRISKAEHLHSLRHCVKHSDIVLTVTFLILPEDCTIFSRLTNVNSCVESTRIALFFNTKSSDNHCNLSRETPVCCIIFKLPKWSDDQTWQAEKSIRSRLGIEPTTFDVRRWAWSLEVNILTKPVQLKQASQHIFTDPALINCVNPKGSAIFWR